MRITKTVGLAGALVASALVGGTLISSVLATDTPSSPGSGGTDAGTERGAYCDTFLNAFAADLGVSTDDVAAAGKAGANAVIDAALAAGDITEEQAERLRDRLDDADGSGCKLFAAGWVRGFSHGFAHGAARGWAGGIMTGDVMEAAADALGIESSDLITQLREAGSLQAVAENAGADYDAVKSAILDALQADLDATNLTDERKAAIIERVTTWLDDGGEVGGLHPGRGHFGGPRQPGSDSDNGSGTDADADDAAA